MSLATEQEILSRLARELHPGGAVRLWLVRLDDAEVHDALDSLLSPHERARAAAYPSAIRARRFIRARGVLRLLLGELIDQAPTDVRFVYGSDGKPSLARGNDAPPPPTFNLSHARDFALIAVAESRRVGVDLAWTRGHTRIAHVAARFFSEPERAALERLGAEDARHVFWRIWVRKEAYLKGRGEGISERIYDTDFSHAAHVVPPRAAIGREGSGGNRRDQDRWEVADVEGLPEDYVGGVALERITT